MLCSLDDAPALHKSVTRGLMWLDWRSRCPNIASARPTRTVIFMYIVLGQIWKKQVPVHFVIRHHAEFRLVFAHTTVPVLAPLYNFTMQGHAILCSPTRTTSELYQIFGLLQLLLRKYGLLSQPRRMSTIGLWDEERTTQGRKQWHCLINCINRYGSAMAGWIEIHSSCESFLLV